MKVFLHISIAILTLSLFSCEQQGIKPCLKPGIDTLTKTVKFEKFSGINVNADADVYVSQGSTQQVSVTLPSNLENELVVEVSGNTLNVNSKRCYANEGIRPKIEVQIPEITRLEISGSGAIFTKTKILCSVVEFKITGAGNIYATTDANRVISTISGSGNIILNGSANSHFIKLPGSGKINAFGFETNDTDIELNGWGLAEVLAQKNLYSRISGSGDVKYKGYPIVKTEISGQGSVTDVN